MSGVIEHETVVELNPFRHERLTPQHLALLFPAAFYQNDESLALHLTESCLVETTTWDGDNAIGETAFWLKVLSTPQSDFLKEQKRLFKTQIADKCKTLPILHDGVDPAPATPMPPAVLDNQSEAPITSDAHSANLQKKKVLKSKPRTLIKQNPNPMSLLLTQKKDGVNSGKGEAAVVATPIANVVPQEPVDAETLDTMTPGFGLNSFKCKSCTFATDTREILNRHNKANHAAERPYACEFCNYTSRYPWNIKSHIENVHLKTKRFKCERCDFTSPQACLLRRHVSRVHCETKDVACEYCDYRTNHKDVLRRHVHMKHTGDFDHKCPYCAFGRDAKYEVEDHINAVHLKSVIYQCSECSFQTYRKITLRAHHKDHDNKELMKCPECDHKTLYPSQLAKHIKDEHPEIEIPPELKEAKLAMNQKNIVTDDMDYTPILMCKCKLCDFTCERISKLKSHVRKMHNRSKYRCHLCHTSFANMRNMKTHYGKKHPGVEVPEAPPTDENKASVTTEPTESAMMIEAEIDATQVSEIDATQVTEADATMLAEVEATENIVVYMEEMIPTENNSTEAV